MPLVFTKFFEDTFHQANGPLNPTNWATESTGAYGPCQVANNLCEMSPSTFGNPQYLVTTQYEAAQFWTGSLPNDQYIQVTLGPALSSTTNVSGSVFYRVNNRAPNNFGYVAFWYGGYGAGQGTITVGNQNFTFVNNLTGLTLSPGDILIFAVVGTTHYIYQNGNLLTAVADATNPTGSQGGIGVSCVIGITDANIADVQMGQAQVPVVPPPGFKSISKGYNGINGNVRWGCSCQTVQDFEADPTGNTIYAVGTINFTGPNGTTSQTIDNRGYSVVNGRIVLKPPFYGLADAKLCLNEVFRKLVTIGMQGS
jgi:hypothetical protein